MDRVLRIVVITLMLSGIFNCVSAVAAPVAATGKDVSLSPRGSAELYFHIHTTGQAIQGQLATIAIDGPVKAQVSCPVGDKSTHCNIQNLPAGRYSISAMDITDGDQHYQGSAMVTPITLRTSGVSLSVINYHQVIGKKIP